MEQNDTFDVEIMGVNYRLKRTGDERRLREVAERVDSMMREIAEKHRLVSSDRLAVLAALRFCDAWSSGIEEGKKKDAEAAAVLDELAGMLKRALRE